MDQANSNATPSAAPAPAPQPAPAPAPAPKAPSEFGVGHIFKYLFDAMKSPFEAFRDNLKHLDNPKNAFILAAIVAGIATLLAIFASILAVVLTRGEDGITAEWFRLGHIAFVPFIFKSILLYAGLILGAGGIFYLSNLVAKRQISFGRFISLSSTAALPFFVASFLSSIARLIGRITFNPNRGGGSGAGSIEDFLFDIERAVSGTSSGGGLTSLQVWNYIAAIIAVIGLVYMIIIAVTLISNEMAFENKSHALYFGLITLSLIFVLADVFVLPRAGRSISADLTSRSASSVRFEGTTYDCEDYREITRDITEISERIRIESAIRARCNN